MMKDDDKYMILTTNQKVGGCESLLVHTENQAIKGKILVAFLFAQALHKHRRAH